MNEIKTKRRYFDISKRIRLTDIGTGQLMVPFLLARQYSANSFNEIPNWKIVPFWMEFKESGLPDESDFMFQPKISRFQRLDQYDSLPELILSSGVRTYRAVAERIPNGDVAFYQIGNECLWTMVPADAEDVGQIIASAVQGPGNLSFANNCRLQSQVDKP